MRRRTAFFDTETLSALREGIRQVVIVAAGYDGRALRFSAPGVRWFEVDHPSTQADKRARLDAAGVAAEHISFVALDLTADDLEAALQLAGHRRAEPSIFIVEGLLGYLPRPVTSKLLSTLGVLAAPGSRLAVAFPIVPRHPKISEKIHLKLRSMVVSAIGEPWLVRFEADEPDAILEAAGWEPATSDRSPNGRARFEGRQGVLICARPLGSGPVPTLGAR